MNTIHVIKPNRLVNILNTVLYRFEQCSNRAHPDKPEKFLKAPLYRPDLTGSRRRLHTETGNADLGSDVGGKDAGSLAVFKKNTIRGEKGVQMLQPLFDFGIEIGHQRQHE